VVVGSGLILVVIVGAWLAVLVPMALRSHDSSASLRSADRFDDAMRVLARKGARDVLVPRRSDASLVVSATRSPRPLIAPGARAVPLTADVPVVLRARRTAAQRRLRTLKVLVGLAILTLGLSRWGVPLAGGLHLLCDGLLVAFVVHLRRQALLRMQRFERQDAVSLPAPRAARIAGIPDRMPLRPAPIVVPAAAQQAPAATGTDGTWSPIPVPPPTYVGKSMAPKRAPRVLDLTKPGEWTAALEGDDAGLEIDAAGPELADIIDRRRAVNGW